VQEKGRKSTADGGKYDWTHLVVGNGLGVCGRRDKRIRRNNIILGSLGRGPLKATSYKESIEREVHFPRQRAGHASPEHHR